MDDWQLIQAYVEQRSEVAFRELVERHAGLVYASALRQVRDAQLAEDVAQTVFILLARKAAHLRRGVILAGWLFNTARFVASRALRSERRRQRREQEALQMNQLHSADDAWQRLEPELDDALADVSRSDREVLLLRFLEKRTLRETGAALGINEEAAKKRVVRALERLRESLRTRGVALSAGALVGALTEQTMAAAPAALVNHWSAGASQAVTGSHLPALFQEVLRARFWGKVKWIGGAAMIGLLGFTAATMPHAARKWLSGGAQPAAPEQSQSSGAITPAPGAEAESPAAPVALRGLRLHVIAAGSGVAVTNARVAFNYVVDEFWTNRFDLTTDASGVCVVSFPFETDRIDVGVVTDGWAARYATWPSEGVSGIASEYTLRLERSAQSAGGQITDPQGQPLGNVEIIFRGLDAGDSSHREPPRERFGFLTPLSVTRTDASGRWRIGFIPVGHHGFELRAVHPEFPETQIAFMHSKPYETDPDRAELKQLWAGTLVTRMSASFAVDGIVVDEQGTPIAGAEVRYHAEKEPGRSDEAGRFRLTRQQAGPLEFTISAEGFAPLRTNTVVGATFPPMLVTLATGAVLRIRAVDEFDQEVPGATVVLEQWGGTWNEHLPWRGTTDRAGRIEWNSAPPGVRLELCAWAGGYCYTRDIHVRADSEEHVIRLRRTLDVYGRVVDAETGRGLREMKAVPGYGPPDRYSNGEDRWHTGSTVRGTNGQFKLTFTENAPLWQLRVSADGYEDWISPPLTNLQTVVLEIAMKKSRLEDGFHGVVELPDGTPAVGATVGLLTLENNFTLRKKSLDGNQRWLRTTGARGEFAFTANPLAHSLAAVHEAGFISVRVNDPHEAVLLRLQRWGRVEGQVDTSARGQPIEELRLYDPVALNYQGHVSLLNSGLAKPDAQFHFVFEDVPPGQLSIFINSGIGIPFHHQTPIVVSPGETAFAIVRERAGALIQGRLVPAPKRRGAGDIVVLQIVREMQLPAFARERGPMTAEELARRTFEFWSSPAGRDRAATQQVFSARLNNDGSFASLERVPPGQYRLSAIFNNSSASQKISIDEEGDSLLDLGEIRLRPAGPQ